MTRVTVVDYGMGNLLSVSRALAHVGAEVVIADTAAKVRSADLLVVPGVGAFGRAMGHLASLDMVDAIRHVAASGRPMLGICLGMQLMFESSTEFGAHQGLGLIPGHVVPVPPVTVDGRPHKVPHIGWNELKESAPGGWSGTILQAIESETPYMYFVHSYMGVPTDPADRLAIAIYGGHAVCAAVKRGNLWGFQGHPEKSGAFGLEILRRFVV